MKITKFEVDAFSSYKTRVGLHERYWKEDRGGRIDLIFRFG